MAYLCLVGEHACVCWIAPHDKCGVYDEKASSICGWADSVGIQNDNPTNYIAIVKDYLPCNIKASCKGGFYIAQ
jgi:hypothetical protein